MSAPLIEEKRARYIDFSFLAVLTARAIRSILSNEQPDSEGMQALPKAERFLREISSGAAFVASGQHPQGFDAVRAVDALDFAMGPMEHLEQLLTDKDIAAYFQDVADALAHSSAPNAQLNQDHRGKLEFAATFFSALYESLAWLLDHPRDNDFMLDARRFSLAA